MYFRPAEREGTASLPCQLHALLGLVVVDPRDERAWRVILFLTEDSNSVGSVDRWRSRKSLWPSTFSGKPVIRMLLRLDLFSRSSVLSLRASFSLDRVMQVDSRVAYLVSMSLSDVSMCCLNCLVVPVNSYSVSRELVRKFGYIAVLHRLEKFLHVSQG